MRRALPLVITTTVAMRCSDDAQRGAGAGAVRFIAAAVAARWARARRTPRRPCARRPSTTSAPTTVPAPHPRPLSPTVVCPRGSEHPAGPPPPPPSTRPLRRAAGVRGKPDVRLRGQGRVGRRRRGLRLRDPGTPESCQAAWGAHPLPGPLAWAVSGARGWVVAVWMTGELSARLIGP
jgi:hypothetical protein